MNIKYIPLFLVLSIASLNAMMTTDKEFDKRYKDFVQKVNKCNACKRSYLYPWLITCRQETKKLELAQRAYVEISNSMKSDLDKEIQQAEKSHGELNERYGIVMGRVREAIEEADKCAEDGLEYPPSIKTEMVSKMSLGIKGMTSMRHYYEKIHQIKVRSEKTINTLCDAEFKSRGE
jgi:hypothetical protein